jgi:methionine aminopeptidase
MALGIRRNVSRYVIHPIAPGVTTLIFPRDTVVTRDGRRSAHFEHTIAVTEHGPEVLTLPE